jgi:hypothetical protein
VERLTDISILIEITGQARNRRLRYDPYIGLFTDEPISGGEAFRALAAMSSLVGQIGPNASAC